MKLFYAQGHLFLGQLYAHSGKKEKALENLKKAEVMSQEMGMDYWLVQTKKLLEMIRVLNLANPGKSDSLV